VGIISDTEIDDKQVVIVNFTTSHPSKESFCLVQSGVHAFISHESCISYLHARITSVARLIYNRDTGAIVPHAPVSPALLARIRRGVPLSNLIPLKCSVIMAKQRLF